jgi:hypothetical protein
MTSSNTPQVEVKFDDPNSRLTAHDEALISTDLQAAVKLDTTGLQVHPEATINLMVHADPAIPTVGSSPSAWAPTEVPGVLQSAAEVAINTGHQITAPHPWQDGDIHLNPAFLTNVSLNPDPAHDTTVPSNQVDAVSLFAHEFIHVLGMSGFYDQQSTSPQAALATQSNFDALVSFGPAGPVFTGPAAEAQNGGAPVELTAGDLYHVGDATTFAADLMNGAHIYNGWNYQPSALDEAMLVDIGYHPNPADHLLAGFV